MATCKACQKYRAEVNQDGVCGKCVNVLARMKTTLKIEYSNPTRAIPFGTNKKILSKAQWSRLKAAIDSYYNSVSSDDIDEANAELNNLYPKRKYAVGKKKNGAVAGFVYLLDGSNGQFKIGRAKDVQKRIGQHLRDYPLKITLLHAIATRDMVAAESFLLSRYASKKTQGEWFALSNVDVYWLCSLTSDELDNLVAQWRK